MRHSAGDNVPVTLVENDDSIADRELNCSAGNVADLFVKVRVRGHDATIFEGHFG